MNKTITCDTCFGSGRLLTMPAHNGDGHAHDERWDDCPDCGGVGFNNSFDEPVPAVEIVPSDVLLAIAGTIALASIVYGLAHIML